MKPLVSIIIVNYKAHKELFTCLTSIYTSKQETPFEVILVDNDEEKVIEKSIKAKFPKVIYIKNENKGFGQGNNVGSKIAKGEYIFFLNPDTKIFNYSLDKLFSFLKKNTHVGIVAPLLIDTENKPFSLQGSGALTPLSAIFGLSFINKFYPTNPISKKYFLLDWNKKNPKNVAVVPGTAFMLSKKLFNDVKGFDENFFLYFEESDLCKRVQQKGLQLSIVPEAKVFHAWGKSTQKSDKDISKVFSDSKFYYFKKHYGLFWAYVVKFVTEIQKEHIFLLGILLLGVFLRFYNLQQNFIFDGEIGDNHLDIKNAYINHAIPLRGPPTSHPWLYFGPLFYWLYEPIWIAFKFNPIAYGYFGAVISVCILIANFFVIKKLFSKNSALISTYLIAISPLFLFTARWSRFFAIVPLLIYPFLFLLKKIGLGEKKWLFMLWFLLGLMLQFHYTPLFLIPFIITILFIRKISLSVKEILQSLLGFFIPFIPLLFYDARQKFSMSINLLLWIPYRILGFFGIYHKNTVSSTVLHENSSSIINFFSYSFSPTLYNSFTLVGLLLFFVIVIFLAYKIFKRDLSFSFLLVIIWGFWGFIALFIHGDAPLHYYVPIYSFPILVLSLFLSEIGKIKFGKIAIFVVLCFLTITNMSYFFSTQWFYNYTQDNLSYSVRQKIAKTIIQNAHGQQYALKRVGYYDDYDKNFAQNYIYLLWLYGNEPVENATVKFTIYEELNKLPKILTKNQQLITVTKTVDILKETL